MSVVRAVMVPHPPILLPEIGRGEEKKIQATADAYAQAAAFTAEARPDTIVVLSPHSVMYADWFHISPGAGASGSFASFGAPQVKCAVRYDEELTETLCAIAAQKQFPAGIQGEKDARLDHATMLPLLWLQKAYGAQALPPIVRIGLSGLPLTEHYRLGQMIAAAAEQLHRRIAVVASGDLSHRLKTDGPYGYRPEGPQYDRRIMDVMGRGAFGELFAFSEAFCDAAGECGHRSFTIMAGCLDGRAVQAKPLSYEGTFGVGYGVCLFAPGEADPARQFLQQEEARQALALQARRRAEDPYVQLARAAVEAWVRSNSELPLPAGLPAEMRTERAGVFVSLHAHGALRGCIGTIRPAENCIAQEIVRNGISACSRDPRFAPVAPAELDTLEYSVDVLGPAEAIPSAASLDVHRYGVIVSSGGRRGLLLPDLEGVDTVEQQIAIAREKAGIAPEETVRLQRFEVVRHV